MTARPSESPDDIDDLTPAALTFMLASSPALADVVVDGLTCSPIGTGQLANS
jgi:hypothetical protein